MPGVSRLDSPELPLTSFPLFSRASSASLEDAEPCLSTPSLDGFLESIAPILVISDAHECNANLSVFLKLAVDYLKTQDETYHTCSILSLRLLNLNLFIKNHQLCLGKILGLMSIFSEIVAGDCAEDALLLKEILSIIVLLLFKLSADETGPLSLSTAICKDEIFTTLRDLLFVEILCRFIAGHVKCSDDSHSSFVILSFSCNIFFQYLYHIILLSDAEFLTLTTCTLIPTLIDDLLSNDNFNNYALAGQDFADVSKLIAYEEFKLLLLVNEQYMMRRIFNKVPENRVIEGLLTTRPDLVNGISGFLNLLVYHMNREESHIIRIQMLKFVYLVTLTPHLCKLAYLNDLKILTDIVIRELNDLDYISAELSHENSVLALTYLKTLYPLLTLTQLNEVVPKYKAPEIAAVLSDVIVNCDVASSDNVNFPQIASARLILKTATKCLSIPWLKTSRKQHAKHKSPGPNLPSNSSSESLASASSLSSRVNSIRLDVLDSNSTSTESFSVSRIASVRASSISDYNKHTTSHNLTLDDNDEKPINIFEANNLNVFLTCTKDYKHDSFKPSFLNSTGGPFAVDRGPSSAQTLGLLNLPKEYLSKTELPPLPKEATKGTPRNALLHEKAKCKKAPPPPPPPSRRRR